MLSKRQRMQCLFNSFGPVNPNAPLLATGRNGRELRGDRDYWDDRHPLSAQWSKLTTLGKWRALMRDLREIAHYYDVHESEPIRN